MCFHPGLQRSLRVLAGRLCLAGRVLGLIRIGCRMAFTGPTATTVSWIHLVHSAINVNRVSYTGVAECVCGRGGCRFSSELRNFGRVPAPIVSSHMSKSMQMDNQTATRVGITVLLMRSRPGTCTSSTTQVNRINVQRNNRESKELEPESPAAAKQLVLA